MRGPLKAALDPKIGCTGYQAYIDICKFLLHSLSCKQLGPGDDLNRGLLSNSVRLELSLVSLKLSTVPSRTCEQLGVVHALGTGDDLLPADEDVEGVAELGVLLARHRVEGPDLRPPSARSGAKPFDPREK